MKKIIFNIATVLASTSLIFGWAEKSIAATYVFDQIGFPNDFRVTGTITTDAIGDLTLNDLNQAKYNFRISDNATVNYTLTDANSTWSSLTLGSSELLITANETELVFDFLTPNDFDFGSLRVTHDLNSSQRWELAQQVDIGSVVEQTATVGFTGGFSTKKVALLAVFPSEDKSFNFTQGGFDGGGMIGGMFAGVDQNGDGLITLGENTSYMFSPKNNSLAKNISHDKNNLEVFRYDPLTKSIDILSSDDVHEYDGGFGTLSSEIEAIEDAIVVEQPDDFFDFYQLGWVGGGAVQGSFQGQDFDNDGFISSSGGEVSAFTMEFQGNDYIKAFTFSNLEDVNLEYEPGTRNFGSGGLTISNENYDVDLNFASISVEQETLESITVTPKVTVPEPCMTIGLVLLGLGKLSRKQTRKNS